MNSFTNFTNKALFFLFKTKSLCNKGMSINPMAPSITPGISQACLSRDVRELTLCFYRSTLPPLYLRL